MTTQQEEGRRRGGGILIALALAAIGAWLVYLWLDGTGGSGNGSGEAETTIGTTRTTVATTTTTTAAPAATTTTVAEASPSPFGRVRAQYGDSPALSALIDFVEDSDPTALSLARLDNGQGMVVGRFGSQADADRATAACAEWFGGTCIEAYEIDDGAASAPWLSSALASLEELGNVPAVSVTVADGEYTLGGVVASEDSKDAVGAAVQALIEPDLTLVNQLEVVDAEVITGGTQSALEDLDLQGITFESGSAVITAEGQAILDEAVAVLTGAVGVEVEVGGHTDSVGSASGNEALSQARAESVVAYLVDGGVDADILTAVGFGESQPVADNGTAEGREQNRRIEFTVTAA